MKNNRGYTRYSGQLLLQQNSMIIRQQFRVSIRILGHVEILRICKVGHLPVISTGWWGIPQCHHVPVIWEPCPCSLGTKFWYCPRTSSVTQDCDPRWLISDTQHTTLCFGPWLPLFMAKNPTIIP
jgi:hypothetical protein